jgi:hypothetical protein
MISNFGKAPPAYPDQEYPPGFYTEMLSKHAHSAIQTYFKLWKIKDKENYVYVFKDEIQNFLAVKKPKFFDDLTDISNEGLLNWKETKKESEDMGRTLITIELVGWSDEYNDY